MKTTKLILALILTAPCALSAPSAIDQTEDEMKEASVALQRQVRAATAATPGGQRPLERSMKEAEHVLQLAQNQASQAIAGTVPRYKRVLGAHYASAPELPLVVATSRLGTTTLAELREDLTVLAKLVDDAISDDRGDLSVRRAMGIVVDWLPGVTSSANLYIEGHGAIVQTCVRFPLAPPKQEEITKPAEKPRNSAWESARRELFGGTNDDAAEVVFPPETREEYSSARVEALKKNILKALINARNFRGLKSDESVTVVVRSRPTTHSQIVFFSSHVSHGKTTPTNDETEATMTIHIKKSDADALATGAIKEEEFGKRACVAIY